MRGLYSGVVIFFFKQKTAYEMRISDWSSDVCSSDLPGGIVGVIGPNGAGKTTLFRMIVGQETPDSGSLRIGETVKLGYVDQSQIGRASCRERVCPYV